MQLDDKKKQASLDVAEDSRETEWARPSFVAELFKGNLAWELIHPYPLQSEEDKRIGDEYMEKVRVVLEKYIDPSDVDRTREVPREGIRALAEIGVFGMKIPKEYGGLGFSQINYSRVSAFIGSYCASTAAWVTSHQSIGVPQPLKLFGTKTQKEKFLPRLAKGAISAFALTEPNVGSDPAKMKVTATPTEDGKHYIINGQKLWITNGTAAELLVVMAKTPSIIVKGKEKQQISAFVVETDTPGFSVVHRCDFMGIRGIANGLLNFDNVRVPAENLIGKEGEGLKIALITLNTGRLSIPAGAGAGGKKAISYGSKWAHEREQWGAPIGKHQNTAIKLAQMASNTFAIEAITWLGCSMADKGGTDIRLEAAMAKYFATESGCKIADDFLQLRGGRGYETAESLAMRGEDPVPAERFLRDARIARIVEGTSEIMRLFIAREAMDVHVRQIIPLLSPKTNKRQHLRKSFLPFYAKWYPKQWLPAGGNFNVRELNGANRAHLASIGKSAKRLARTMFHTMVKYQQKLEREQIIMSCFVDIGTDLFAMAASLAYAEALLPRAENKQELQDLVDLFCRDARERIRRNFEAVKHNHNSLYNRIANNAMDGKYEWLCTGIYDGIPPGYLKYMNKSLEEFTRRQAQELPAVETSAPKPKPALEPVAK
ncbi:MAG: acyl-CoA dehydrogenase family protein [Candidatus Hydrogenedentes bacterium]|nr:acyl-CoA dehydrogenase family protein [Candidatus Hydrogenedentota bacterium]